MSDNKCRCDDIRYYDKEIEKINNVYMHMNSNHVNLSVISNHTKTIVEKQPYTYEAKNKIEVSTKIGKMTDDMGEKLREAIRVINAEKDRLKGKRSKLSAEDDRYHEEERERRQRGNR